MGQQKRWEMTHTLWSTGKDFNGGSTKQLSMEELTPRLLSCQPGALF